MNCPDCTGGKRLRMGGPSAKCGTCDGQGIVRLVPDYVGEADRERCGACKGSGSIRVAGRRHEPLPGQAEIEFEGAER